MLLCHVIEHATWPSGICESLKSDIRHKSNAYRQWNSFIKKHEEFQYRCPAYACCGPLDFISVLIIICLYKGPFINYDPWGCIKCIKFFGSPLSESHKNYHSPYANAPKISVSPLICWPPKVIMNERYLTSHLSQRMAHCCTIPVHIRDFLFQK